MVFIKNRKYANPSWRSDATRFIQSRLGNRNRYVSLYKNFKHNMNYRINHLGYVGWTAPHAPINTPAARAQYIWRRKYFKAHGRVI